jgi:hypothetical protein
MYNKSAALLWRCLAGELRAKDRIPVLQETGVDLSRVLSIDI